MASNDNEEAIRSYKTILAALIDRRPSGTRQRLADALGKHRSFITQVTSASYATPLPERHIPTILSVCHFNAAEQEEFLQAYRNAHPGRLRKREDGLRLRHLSLLVPDFGDEDRNRLFDQAVTDIAHKMAALAQPEDN